MGGVLAPWLHTAGGEVLVTIGPAVVSDQQKLQSSWCTPTAATPTDAWLCPTPFRVKLHMFKKYADLFHDLNSRQLRGAPMLPTAATALPAAQFAHVFEKYADLFHDLNSRQLRGAPRGQEIRRFVS